MGGGDISCRSVMIEKGAFIEGRLVRSHGAKNGQLAIPEPVHEVDAALVDAEPTKRKAPAEPRHLSGKSDFTH